MLHRMQRNLALRGQMRGVLGGKMTAGLDS
jgi:hypothetical protein